MKVILTRDVEGWGTIGDIIEVKDGFARNYLIPKGYAYPATDNYVRMVQNILKQKARKLEKEKEKALQIKEKIDNQEIVLKKKVGLTGKLYGSVTAADIAQSIKDQFDVEIDRKKIMLRNPIRDIGIYTIKIRLHPEVSATIKVNVQPEEQ
ncbi:MAG: 50S ribosomal protein L9 [Aquificae bacterium]|nr:50S ribosomal protein L9 [Aquificota bacterium]